MLGAAFRKDSGVVATFRQHSPPHGGKTSSLSPYDQERAEPSSSEPPTGPIFIDRIPRQPEMARHAHLRSVSPSPKLHGDFSRPLLTPPLPQFLASFLQVSARR